MEILNQLKIGNTIYDLAAKYDSNNDNITDTYIKKDEISLIELAVTGAENVNATITEGNIFEVTDRTGTKKTLDLNVTGGTSAGFGEIAATVDNSIGTPDVTVTTSGTNEAKNFTFAFTGLKGEKGEVGMQGNSGVADASNKILVNDAITGGETDFLSAEVGKLGILTYDCSKGGSVTHATLQDAINSVPITFLKVGLTITYKSEDTIHCYTLKANSWSTDSANWFSLEDKLSDLEKIKIDKTSILQESGNAEDKVMSQKAVSAKLRDLQGTASSLDSTKLPKDNDSESSISDGSDEFVIADSNNHIALKVDRDGMKARMLNICDENGNVVKTITKELLDKIENLSQNSDKYGNTCKLQEKKGTYYEISAFSIKNGEQDLKAEFSTNKSKFGERTLHLYVHGKEETELTSRTNRGSVEISFNTPIVVTESLSFWIYMPTKCFINHRFESIKNPDPTFDFVFSGNNFSESFSMTPQYRLSPSWMLFKVLNKNLRGKEVTKVSLSITNFDTNPNMDVWLGCFVADQRFVPTINFNMDSDLGGCVNSKFTDFLESNNIPANIIVKFGSNQMNDGQKIGRRLYFNGIVDIGVRTHVVSIHSDSSQENPENINVQTANYLKKVKAIQYYLNNDIISDGNPIKPIISAHCSHNYIDDVLAHALKTCGYRIIRHSNSYNYCSYIDSESCFIGTIGIGFTSNIHSVSDLTDEWKNNIETRFKEYVDNLIEWGMVGSFFTHEVKTREELATNWDSNAIPVDVIEDCINYVLEKEKAGLIQFKTLDNIYYNSVGNDVCNN